MRFALEKELFRVLLVVESPYPLPRFGAARLFKGRFYNLSEFPRCFSSVSIAEKQWLTCITQTVDLTGTRSAFAYWGWETRQGLENHMRGKYPFHRLASVGTTHQEHA